VTQDDTPAHRSEPPSAPTEPPPATPTPSSTGYVACLGVCLDLVGDPQPRELLMGVSGEGFKLLYDHTDPTRALDTVAHNPLRAAASALGYDSEVHWHAEPHAALDLLQEKLEAGPVIVRLGGEWAVVSRGESGLQRTDSRGHTVQVGPSDLLAAWQPEPGLLELGLPGYYFFQLGAKQREPDQKDAALGSIRRGVRLMIRRAKVGTCSSGLAAYEDMQRSLRRPRRGARNWRLELAKFLRWQDGPLEHAAGSRHAVADYLRLVEKHFEPETREHLSKAARKYQRISEAFAALPRLDPTLVPPFDPDSDQPLSAQERRAIRAFSGVRRRCARMLRKIQRLEQEAIDELNRSIDTVERLKREK